MAIKLIIPPLIERQNRPCETCIGMDSECCFTSCWIREDDGYHRMERDYAGTNPVPCRYHMTSSEYREFVDALIEARGEDGSFTD